MTAASIALANVARLCPTPNPSAQGLFLKIVVEINTHTYIHAYIHTYMHTARIHTYINTLHAHAYLDKYSNAHIPTYIHRHNVALLCPTPTPSALLPPPLLKVFSEYILF